MKKELYILSGGLNVFVLVLAVCSPSPQFHQDNRVSHVTHKEKPVKQQKIHVETGLASFTADEQHGRKTANGEIYNMREYVAAHRTLPFNTLVRVRNSLNDKTVEVRINDRGPFIEKRIIDVSFQAARDLGFIDRGVVPVEIKVVRWPE